jgi:LEA14-like dessication related protein
MRRWILAFAVAVAALGCSRPDPPTLTPEQAKVTRISPDGLDMEVRLEAYNPNSVDLSARSLKAKVTLDGKYHVGDVKSAAKVVLPAHKRTKLEVPLSVKWTDLSGLISLAASNRAVPYELDGTVEVGGDALSLDVPFKLRGMITHDELVRATMNSLPKIPGLP